ncbi:hypothetical protein GF362_04420 [Candidatus Dojkabacteria bacterium]|nr:hypothetical protein [Candidatus Dojkabacteria bacterium]
MNVVLKLFKRIPFFLCIFILVFVLDIKFNRTYVYATDVIYVRINNTCPREPNQLKSIDSFEVEGSDLEPIMTSGILGAYCPSAPDGGQFFQWFNGPAEMEYTFHLTGEFESGEEIDDEMVTATPVASSDGMGGTWHYVELTFDPPSSATSTPPTTGTTTLTPTTSPGNNPGTINFISPVSSVTNAGAIPLEVSLEDINCDDDYSFRVDITDISGARTTNIFFQNIDNDEIDDGEYSISQSFDLLRDPPWCISTDACSNQEFRLTAYADCGSETNRGQRNFTIYKESEEITDVSIEIETVDLGDTYEIQLAFNNERRNFTEESGTEVFENVAFGNHPYTARAVYTDGDEEVTENYEGEVEVTEHNQIIIIRIRKGGSHAVVAPMKYVSISNEGLEGCAVSTGYDLTCANCIARKANGDPFTSVEEVVTSFESQDAIYTNNVYTAFGCWDPTYSGTITRILQIGLGISGAMILLRIGQALTKIMSADNPEKKKEGVDMIVSAFMALIMLLCGAIGLRFLGINVLKVLPPGTIEVE